MRPADGVGSQRRAPQPLPTESGCATSLPEYTLRLDRRPVATKEGEPDSRTREPREELPGPVVLSRVLFGACDESNWCCRSSDHSQREGKRRNKQACSAPITASISAGSRILEALVQFPRTERLTQRRYFLDEVLPATGAPSLESPSGFKNVHIAVKYSNTAPEQTGAAGETAQRQLGGGVRLAGSGEPGRRST